MADINLRYGNSHYYLEYDRSRFDLLKSYSNSHPLSDAEIGARLDQPIGSPAIEEIVAPGSKVLIVVPDATREVGCGQVINILIRRLIANGTEPFDISIIFATGIHRPVTDPEKSTILTPFIAQRIKTLDHRPRDISRITRLGETDGGIPIELNQALNENDHVILIGGISFHYFAGFTGGRKLICPGLASSKTISASHKLAFDCETRSRRDGVGTALLDGNAVHEAFVEAALRAKPAFCISTIVNEKGELAELYCGDWIISHRQACEEFAKENSIRIADKRDIVVASCGGSPHDINIIQAHKTLEAASHACNEGGTIILLAECRDGLGRDDFLNWFEAESSSALADRLCESYQVNGQTAWSLLRKNERYDVRLVSELPEGKTEKMRMKHFRSLAAALEDVGNKPGFIVPAGSRIRVHSD